MPDPTITIQIRLSDSVVLPELLRDEIERTESAIARVSDSDYTADIRVYLAQLRACLAAVEKARQA
jgi:hypothetical protein